MKERYMMKLTKHHGLGNDFLVALSSQNPGIVPDPGLAQRLCHRNFGVGADGLIYLVDHEDPTVVGEMVLINSNGSLAEISGNGIRCLAQAILLTQENPTDMKPLRIYAGNGVRDIQFISGDPRFEVQVEVAMGTVTPGPKLTPEAQAVPGLRRMSLNIGNPHVVVEADPDTPISDEQLDELGERVNASFPLGTNMHVITAVEPSGSGHVDRLHLTVWERGAGRTFACGSGATAAAWAAHNWGLSGEIVDIEMPGGVVNVDVSGPEAVLIGPAVFVAEVTVDA